MHLRGDTIHGAASERWRTIPGTRAPMRLAGRYSPAGRSTYSRTHHGMVRGKIPRRRKYGSGRGVGRVCPFARHVCPPMKHRGGASFSPLGGRDRKARRVQATDLASPSGTYKGQPARVGGEKSRLRRQPSLTCMAGCPFSFRQEGRA